LNIIFDRGADEYNALEVLKKLHTAVNQGDMYSDYRYAELVNFLFDDIITSSNLTG